MTSHLTSKGEGYLFCDRYRYRSRTGTVGRRSSVVGHSLAALSLSFACQIVGSYNQTREMQSRTRPTHKWSNCAALQ